MLTIHTPPTIDHEPVATVTEPAVEPQEAEIERANEELTETANDYQEARNESVDPEETFWEELELIGELAEAERDCQQMEAELSELKEEVKDAKKAYEAAVIRVRRVASKIADLAAGKTIPKKDSEPESKSVGESANDEWQDTPTDELLDGVKGLGAKKLEAIVDLAPTAGKLEELRGEASRQCKSFADVLPKGCGQSIADAIEDRLVQLVANHNTPPASEQVEPRVEAESPASEADEETSEAHQPADGEEYEDTDTEDDSDDLNSI